MPESPAVTISITTSTTTESVAVTNTLPGRRAGVSVPVSIPGMGTLTVERVEDHHVGLRLEPSRTGSARHSGRKIADKLVSPSEDTTQWLVGQLSQIEQEDQERLGRYRTVGVILGNPAEATATLTGEATSGCDEQAVTNRPETTVEKVYEDIQSVSSSDEELSPSVIIGAHGIGYSDQKASTEPTKRALDTSGEEDSALSAKARKTEVLE